MTTTAMPLQDNRVDIKLAISGLWTAMLLVFAYVDIFAFWRADVVRGALDGVVPGAGLTVDQAFLAQATAYVLVPILLIVVTLLAPARISKWVNLIGSLVYAATVVASALGETWTYYLIGSAAEVILLLTIAFFSWTWPRARGAGT